MLRALSSLARSNAELLPQAFKSVTTNSPLRNIVSQQTAKPFSTQAALSLVHNSAVSDPSHRTPTNQRYLSTNANLSPIAEAVRSKLVRSTPLTGHADKAHFSAKELNQLQAFIDLMAFNQQDGKACEDLHKTLMQSVNHDPAVQSLVKCLMEVMHLRFTPVSSTVEGNTHQNDRAKPLYSPDAIDAKRKEAQILSNKLTSPQLADWQRLTDLVCHKLVRTNMFHPMTADKGAMLCFENNQGKLETIMTIPKATMLEVRYRKIASGGTRCVEHNANRLSEVHPLAEDQERKHEDWFINTGGAKRTFCLWQDQGAAYDQDQIIEALEQFATLYTSTFDSYQDPGGDITSKTLAPRYAPVVVNNGFDFGAIWGPDVGTGFDAAIDAANREATNAGCFLGERNKRMSGGPTDIPHSIPGEVRTGITAEGAFHSNKHKIDEIVQHLQSKHEPLRFNIIGSPPGDVSGSTLTLFLTEVDIPAVPNMAYDGRHGILFSEGPIIKHYDSFKKVILDMVSQKVGWEGYLPFLAAHKGISDDAKVALQEAVSVHKIDEDNMLSIGDKPLLSREQFTRQLCQDPKANIFMSCGHGTWFVNNEAERAEHPGAITVKEIPDSLDLIFSPANLTCSPNAQDTIQQEGHVYSLGPVFENGAGTAASRASLTDDLQGKKVSQPRIKEFQGHIKYFAMARQNFLEVFEQKEPDLRAALGKLRQYQSMIRETLLNAIEASSNPLLDSAFAMKAAQSFMYFPSEAKFELLEQMRENKVDIVDVMTWWQGTYQGLGLTDSDILEFAADPTKASDKMITLEQKLEKELARPADAAFKPQMIES